jgi:hypothetical protein
MRAAPSAALLVLGLTLGCGEDAPAPTPTPPCAQVWAFVDLDLDGIGAGEAALHCLEALERPGLSTRWGDCDDSDSRIGVPSLHRAVDEDGDGVYAALGPEGLVTCPLVVDDTGRRRRYGSARPEQPDCDDADPTVWRASTFRSVDADGDGRPVPLAAPVQRCVGEVLEPDGLRTASVDPDRADCDDTDPTRYFYSTCQSVDADGDGRRVVPPTQHVCVGDDQSVCSSLPANGDCNDTDPTIWAMSLYLGCDLDGDGAFATASIRACEGDTRTLPDCTLQAPDPSIRDCDDRDPTRWRNVGQSAVDADGDGVSVPSGRLFCVGAELPPGFEPPSDPPDCDDTDPARWRPLSHQSRDADGDGVFVDDVGTSCLGADDEGRSARALSSTDRRDCDDTDPTIAVRRTAFVDADGDGRGAGFAMSLCASSTVTPPGYATSWDDCDDADAQVWALHQIRALDADGDGAWTSTPTFSLCASDVPPAGTRTTSPAPAELDCDDADPSVHSWLLVFRDVDGDGVGAGPPSWLCVDRATTRPPPGWSLYGDDANDADPSVGPDEDDDDLP